MAKHAVLTPLELQIMQVLWSRGASTVAEAQAALPGEPAYTTVQTMLNILVRKCKAAREPEGRAFRYRAIVSRDRALGSALRDLVGRMFDGDPEALLLTMVDTRQITPAALSRIATKLAEEPGVVAPRAEKRRVRSNRSAQRKELP